MSKPSEAAGRIEGLRNSLGMTQTQFAEALGVSQSRISEWGAGTATPSAEAWIKLAALAAKGDPSEALFFWTQLGTQPEALLSVADMLLKDRVRDSKPLEDEGKVVLIPPFTEGAWKSQQSRPPLRLDATGVSNKASTYYIVAQPPSVWDAGRRGFIPGQTIFFDASGASTQRFQRFRGQEVLVNFEKGGIPAWSEGLFVGQADIDSQAGTTHLVLGRSDTPRGNWRPDETFTLMSFQPAHHMPASIRERSHPHHPESHHQEWNRAYRDAESELVSRLRFPEQCRVLGRVIARFSPEPAKG